MLSEIHETMTDQIIINDPLSLLNYELVEDSLLTQTESFKHYFYKVDTIYTDLVSQIYPELTYRPYQAKNAAAVCVRRRHILTHALGSGKTNTALLAMVAIYGRQLQRRAQVHIIVPNILSAQRWVEEIERLNRVEDVRLSYAVVGTEKELLGLPPGAGIIIYNHDFPKRRARSLTGSRNFISRLLVKRFKPSYIVIDEAHNLQQGSSRMEHLRYVISRAKRRVALTGTLTELPHVFHLCRLIYGKYFPFRDLGVFSKRYSTKTKLYTNYTGQTGENAPERYIQKLDPMKAPEYYELMRRFVHRVRIDDPEVVSCITIPKNELNLVGVPPTPEQLELHTAYLDAHRNALRLSADRRNAEALRLLVPLIQVANCPTHGSNKLNKLVDLVQKASGKVIVFCSYVLSARIAARKLQQTIGAERVIRLYAQDPEETPAVLSQDARVDLIARFQHDPTVKVGVFSINLTAESIDLTAASDVIYYCIPWSSIKIQQSLSRAVRPGNKNEIVNTHYIYTSGLIDQHQVMLATEKIKGSRLLMDYDLGDDVTEASIQDLSPAEAIKKLLAG
jgi:superfamily II DNA or RNA helicase